MVRVLGLVALTLLASAGAASACPFGKTAATTDQTTTSELPVDGTTNGTTGTDTGSKTGG